mmetsp:Transcript_12585/g.31929  ORF Transcript_12585/g.31929 Transcript_12585/m.31929 type:complete len:395 (+) Transcript_12585:3-1187(+)
MPGFESVSSFCDRINRAAESARPLDNDGPCFVCEYVPCCSEAKESVRCVAQEKALTVFRNIKQSRFKLEHLRKQMGVAEVMHWIRTAACPVVVHNGMMDLVHLMQQFVGNIPLGWDDFKTMLLRNIPGGVFDTKVIAKNQIPTDDSEGDNSTGYDVNLQELHSRLFRRNTPTTPEITHADNFDRYKGVSVEESTHHHEAGYDAYLTGCCFASLLQHCGAEEEGEITGFIPTTTSVGADKSDAPRRRDTHDSILHSKIYGPVGDWANKIHPMRSDYVYFDIAGSDPEPERNNVIHIKVSRGKNVTTPQLAQCFNKCDSGPMTISWFQRSRSEALVSLGSERKRDACLSLLKYASTDFTATAYAQWRHEALRSDQRSQNKRQSPGNSSKPVKRRNI